MPPRNAHTASSPPSSLSLSPIYQPRKSTRHTGNAVNELKRRNTAYTNTDGYAYTPFTSTSSSSSSADHQRTILSNLDKHLETHRLQYHHRSNSNNDTDNTSTNSNEYENKDNSDTVATSANEYNADTLETFMTSTNDMYHLDIHNNNDDNTIENDNNHINVNASTHSTVNDSDPLKSMYMSSLDEYRHTYHITDKIPHTISRWPITQHTHMMTYTHSNSTSDTHHPHPNEAEKPRLLHELETILSTQLSTLNKHHPSYKQAELLVYKKIFSLFFSNFSIYKPLLSSIQHIYHSYIHHQAQLIRTIPELKDKLKHIDLRIEQQCQSLSYTYEQRITQYEEDQRKQVSDRNTRIPLAEC
jgi:hypothetical protein